MYLLKQLLSAALKHACTFGLRIRPCTFRIRMLHLWNPGADFQSLSVSSPNPSMLANPHAQFRNSGGFQICTRTVSGSVWSVCEILVFLPFFALRCHIHFSVSESVASVCKSDCSTDSRLKNGPMARCFFGCRRHSLYCCIYRLSTVKDLAKMVATASKS